MKSCFATYMILLLHIWLLITLFLPHKTTILGTPTCLLSRTKIISIKKALNFLMEDAIN